MFYKVILITIHCFNLNISRLFFFNNTATTAIYTLSLHDALPIYLYAGSYPKQERWGGYTAFEHKICDDQDRKSTRLNSSHITISYAVFCLKKKKNKI